MNLAWSVEYHAVLTLALSLAQYTRVSKYFKTDRLRRVFSFASMCKIYSLFLHSFYSQLISHSFNELPPDLGGSPYDLPGTYSLLVYSEQSEGIWYPIGGFHAVVAGLVRIAERNGALFRLSTPVAKVLLDPLDKKKAIGVKLESGEELRADVVVVNADLIYSMNHLFGEPTTYAKKLAQKPVSCSSISFYWSIDR